MYQQVPARQGIHGVSLPTAVVRNNGSGERRERSEPLFGHLPSWDARPSPPWMPAASNGGTTAMIRGRHGKSPAHGTSNTRLAREQRSFALGMTQAVFLTEQRAVRRGSRHCGA